MRKRMKPAFKSLLACGLVCCFAFTLNAQSSYSLEQLQQISAVNAGPELPAQPSTTLKSSAVCDDIIYDYNDPSICSVSPNPLTGLIDIVVGFNDCSFPPEIDNGDGTLTVQGLTTYVDPNGANIYLGSVLESATNNTEACSTMPLMVPPNMTCEPILAEFAAEATTFIVDAETGVITSFVANPDCELEIFTVTINPTLIIDIVEDNSDGCGSATVQLLAENGDICSEPLTATCTDDGDVSIPLGETYGCVDDEQTILCANCPQPEIQEPAGVCNCANGIDLDGDGNVDIHPAIYTITDPAGAGQGWALTSVAGFVDASGNVIMVPPSPAPPVLLPEDAANPGAYTFAVFVPADGATTYAATFTAADGDEFIVSGGPCAVCEPEPEVPTVGEWGLIILGLLMSIAAIVGIRQRAIEIA